MPLASCAGSRKRLNNHFCFQYKDKSTNHKGHEGARREKQRCQAVYFLREPSCPSWFKVLMSESSNLKIAVIGGGPGGYAAAFLAADLGMTVTLIDPELNPGGVCLYTPEEPTPELQSR